MVFVLELEMRQAVPVSPFPSCLHSAKSKASVFQNPP